MTKIAMGKPGKIEGAVFRDPTAAHTTHPPKASMQLDDLPAPGQWMKPVDILSDQPKTRTGVLK